jgi:hypothetical protein
VRVVEEFARSPEVVSRPGQELKRIDAEETLESPFQSVRGAVTTTEERGPINEDYTPEIIEWQEG